jgi:hypothetical protein
MPERTVGVLGEAGKENAGGWRREVEKGREPFQSCERMDGWGQLEELNKNME